MPTSGDKIARLNTDLHDLTSAMDRAYNELSDLQAKKQKEMKIVEQRYDNNIGKVQREYEGFSRRMEALKRDIVHEQDALDRELKLEATKQKQAANDNLPGKPKKTSVW